MRVHCAQPYPPPPLFQPYLVVPREVALLHLGSQRRRGEGVLHHRLPRRHVAEVRPKVSVKQPCIPTDVCMGGGDTPRLPHTHQWYAHISGIHISPAHVVRVAGPRRHWFGKRVRHTAGTSGGFLHGAHHGSREKAQQSMATEAAICQHQQQRSSNLAPRKGQTMPRVRRRETDLRCTTPRQARGSRSAAPPAPRVRQRPASPHTRTNRG